MFEKQTIIRGIILTQTKDIIEMIDGLFPFDLAESWDNCGLQAGELDWPVRKIMVGLDVSMGLLEDAAQWDADMVLTHHPLLIKGEKRLDFSKMPGSAVAFSARTHISIVSAHTNLDKASQGLNDYVAEKIGLKVASAFFQESCSRSATLQEGDFTGLGRICSLPAPLGLRSMASCIKDALGLPHVLVIGDSCHEIRTAALCTGSGGSLVDHFLHSEADVYITGDLKYHEARTIEDHGKMALDIGHFGSEILAVNLLVEKIAQRAAQEGHKLEIKGYSGEKDPFIIA